MVTRVLSVKLVREDSSTPWGFRMEGGVDVGHALNIQAVKPGGLADLSGLRPGDLVLRINKTDVRHLTHEEAKMEIIRSSNDFEMVVERVAYGSMPAAEPVVTSSTVIQPMFVSPTKRSAPVPAIYRQPQPPKPVPTMSSPTCANLKTSSPLHNFPSPGVTYNVNPIPFGQPVPAPGSSLVAHSADGRVKRVLHNTYNSPMGLYSERNASSQFGSTLAQKGVTATGPSGQQASLRCAACGDPIRGVMVRVHNEIPMHPECLKCCRCGVGLRNIGYFYINEALYCDKHAQEAVRSPPGGGRGIRPIPVFK
ncbi:unnamed protein product [Schistocephalus solidus]|uniref:PDZ and LIM domain protein 4 n=1 Tax=Schistocephalus solidus TaxID=70667 RepID=A0A0X3PPR8_SCHSO|nr:unnamed protein product [Schistocephalus solidus]